MKSNFLIGLGATLLLVPLSHSVAQPAWQTVDNLAKSRGRDLIVDSAGNFVSLAIDDSTSSTGPVSTAVSVSADHGVTWQTVGSIAGYALDLTAAPDGALFATGNRSATVSGRAFLWQSLDHEATWTVSDPSVGLPVVMLVTDVAAGNSGAVYVCGYTSGRWLVRKGQRNQSGITWTTVDNPALAQATSVFVRPGIAGQADEILVCGGGWTVRRSLNSGATWTTLDTSSGSAFALTTAPNGAIYVVGRVTKTVGGATEYGWQVRKSSNGGASWANVDYVANGWPQYSITVDPSGRVFAVGFMNSTPQTWMVRGSSDGGATWTTTDSFLPSGASYSQGMAVASDAFGNICVSGEVHYGTTMSAPIRRLSAP